MDHAPRTPDQAMMARWWFVIVAAVEAAWLALLAWLAWLGQH